MTEPTHFTLWASLAPALGVLAALLLTTVWHELGHLLVAWLFRVPVKLIAVGLGPALWRHTLHRDLRLEVRAVPLGMAIGVVGRRTPEGRARRPASHDLAVATAGPLASLALAPILAVVAFSVHIAGIPSAWILATGLLSAVLGLLNLLPIPGLDGGHMLLLSLAMAGWQLSPQHEVLAHRMGIRVLLAASIVMWAAQVLGKI